MRRPLCLSPKAFRHCSSSIAIAIESQVRYQASRAVDVQLHHMTVMVKSACVLLKRFLNRALTEIKLELSEIEKPSKTLCFFLQVQFHCQQHASASGPGGDAGSVLRGVAANAARRPQWLLVRFQAVKNQSFKLLLVLLLLLIANALLNLFCDPCVRCVLNLSGGCAAGMQTVVPTRCACNPICPAASPTSHFY